MLDDTRSLFSANLFWKTYVHAVHSSSSNWNRWKSLRSSSLAHQLVDRRIDLPRADRLLMQDTGRTDLDCLFDALGTLALSTAESQKEFRHIYLSTFQAELEVAEVCSIPIGSLSRTRQAGTSSTSSLLDQSTSSRRARNIPCVDQDMDPLYLPSRRPSAPVLRARSTRSPASQTSRSSGASADAKPTPVASELNSTTEKEIRTLTASNSKINKRRFSVLKKKVVRRNGARPPSPEPTRTQTGLEWASGDGRCLSRALRSCLDEGEGRRSSRGCRDARGKADTEVSPSFDGQLDVGIAGAELDEAGVETREKAVRWGQVHDIGVASSARRMYPGCEEGDKTSFASDSRLTRSCLRRPEQRVSQSLLSTRRYWTYG